MNRSCEERNHCVTALSLAPEGKRRVRQPKATVEKKRKYTGWNFWNEVRTIAKDRGHSRDSLTALWDTGSKKDR